MDMLVKFASYGLIHGDFNEFNLMVDEEMKLYAIDFPQMVSTKHKEANFYFERDQNCIQILFKRKFGFICDRKHSLSEIQCIRRLDDEVRASGYLTAVQGEKHENDELDKYFENAKQQSLEGEHMEENHEEEDPNDDQEGIEGDEEMNEEGDENEPEVDENELKQLGNIEEEMAKLEGAKAVEAVAKEKVIEKPEEIIETWEETLERRQKMKALKKEQAKTKKMPAATVTEARDEKKDEVKEPKEAKEVKEAKGEEESSEEEDSREEDGRIKDMLKKKYRKKKVYKCNKNHEKQKQRISKDAY